MAGDEGAWRELVDRHGPLVYSVCLSSGLSATDAEDVSQEVMLSAFRSLPSFGGCRLSTWLYRIARRRLADHFRSPRRREVASGLPGDPYCPDTQPASGPDPQAHFIEGLERDRLAAALTDLGEPTRSVMLAYYGGEMAVLEIARDHGLPENTVKSYLRRGRLALRERLQESR